MLNIEEDFIFGCIFGVPWSNRKLMFFILTFPMIVTILPVGNNS